MANIDPALWQRNLSALAAHQPAMADRLRQAAEGIEATAVEGRDHTPTFRIAQADGKSVWLGGCSTPTLSAEALAGGLSRNHASLVVPGFMTGLEIVRLLERLARHAAAFVIEEDVRAAVLVLHLYDYSQALAEGRLVVLTGTDWEADLVAFYRSHPGYELPRTVLQIPQRSPVALSHVQQRLERKAADIQQVHTQALSDALARIAAHVRTTPIQDPGVVVLTLQPTPHAFGQVARLAAACEALGWSVDTCIPDQPARAHLCAYVQAVARANADMILAVGGMPPVLRKTLPAELPVVAWRPGHFEHLPAGDGPREVWCVASHSAPGLSIATGEDRSNRLLVVPPGADDRLLAFDSDPSLFQSQPNREPPTPDVPTFDILLAGDVPDDSPEALQLALPSHALLLSALRKRVLEAQQNTGQPLNAALLDIEKLLERAERESGVTLMEDTLRKRFAAIILSHLGPSCMADVLARRLDGATSPAVAGTGWSGRTGPGVTVFPAIPHAAARAELLRRSACVVIPWLTDDTLELALDALLLGCEVALIVHPRQFDHNYPELASVRGFFTLTEDGRAVVPGAAGREHPGHNPDRTRAARGAVQRQHMTSHRLEALRRRLSG